MRRSLKRRRLPRTVFISAVLLLVAAMFFIAKRYNLFPQKSYTGQDFGVERLHSTVDFNHNGVDDYTDILLGARADAEQHPAYNGAYYDGGYPPDDIGVCTDVIWRAFKQAGYSLRYMVDGDILMRREAYPQIERRDNNIDFRRVGNLRVFFEAHAEGLTLDLDKIEQWQAGDIVIFGDDRHIGILSDKRNEEGQPFIIHNGGQPNREEDYLKRSEEVTGHYRFDASTIPAEVLVPWEE